MTDKQPTFESATYYKTDTSALFKFAEEHYDIGWNPCNDVFFGNSIKYTDEQTICLDCLGYVTIGSEYETCLEIPKDIVLAQSKADQSYIILGAFLEHNGITSWKQQVMLTN